MRIFTLGIATLFAVSACTTSDTATAEPGSTTTPADNPVRTAALTANAMAANPAAADSIFSAGGYTKDGFQQLMYEIAADSVKSSEFARIRGR